ncbi:hypothetical protein G6O67_004129 [Ophiocordyceps sinensis]|uniref:Uncharacterized protein n=1 Tax=Ophiocordyceps sinensis TaxID=72228 RepID=A0A8H4PNF0_9HYPO|nr:hypothetical protein G6O67_004129 [Ophiocordyceps sinensis]
MRLAHSSLIHAVHSKRASCGPTPPSRHLASTTKSPPLSLSRTQPPPALPLRRADRLVGSAGGPRCFLARFGGGGASSSTGADVDAPGALRFFCAVEGFLFAPVALVALAPLAVLVRFAGASSAAASSPRSSATRRPLFLPRVSAPFLASGALSEPCPSLATPAWSTSCSACSVVAAASSRAVGNSANAPLPARVWLPSPPPPSSCSTSWYTSKSSAESLCCSFSASTKAANATLKRRPMAQCSRERGLKLADGTRPVRPSRSAGLFSLSSSLRGAAGLSSLSVSSSSTATTTGRYSLFASSSCSWLAGDAEDRGAASRTWSRAMPG